MAEDYVNLRKSINGQIQEVKEYKIQEIGRQVF